MNVLTAPIKSDTWTEATWEEFIQATENPDYDKAKFYYYQNQLRIEMSPIGNDHAHDHSTILGGIHLYLATHDLNVAIKDNCSYRKADKQEAQPDISCYVGNNADVIPSGTSIISLDEFPPDLVIEIANTSLADDQGKKRLLYEELGVKEYWIVNVKDFTVTAFRVHGQGSYRIHISQVLEGLQLSLFEEALKMGRETSHTQAAKWLLSQFS
ncbi:Uma2 family endonuclease [Synechocystis sp. B12]|nr:Uma2 family endonuclease [Synechocystis sp. B12]